MNVMQLLAVLRSDLIIMCCVGFGVRKFTHAMLWEILCCTLVLVS